MSPGRWQKFGMITVFPVPTIMFAKASCRSPVKTLSSCFLERIPWIRVGMTSPVRGVPAIATHSPSCLPLDCSVPRGVTFGKKKKVVATCMNASSNNRFLSHVPILLLRYHLEYSGHPCSCQGMLDMEGTTTQDTGMQASAGGASIHADFLFVCVTVVVLACTLLR